MMRHLAIAGILLAAAAAPASANHIFNLGVPFDNRGQCEAMVADLSHDDQDSLLDRYPNLFDSPGDVASFLTRAFPCERQSDGKWYIQDRRNDVLNSEWFLRK